MLHNRVWKPAAILSVGQNKVKKTARTVGSQATVWRHTFIFGRRILQEFQYSSIGGADNNLDGNKSS